MEIILSILVIALSISNIMLWKAIRTLAEASKTNSETIVQVHTNLTDYVLKQNNV